MEKQNVLYVLFIVGLMAIFAYMVLGAFTGVSVISPAADTNYSGDLLLNATLNGDADNNATNVTFYFFNADTGALVYNVTFGPDNEALNITFNYTIPNTATVLSDGTYNLTVNATNSTKHEITNDTITGVQIDNTNPTSTITSVNSKTSSGSWSNNQTLTMVFTASDGNLNYWNISVYNSSDSIVNTTQETTSNVSAQVSLGVSYDDDYTVNLTVVDNVSNSNISSFAIYIDTANPSVSGADVTSITSSGGSLTATASDANSGISSCSYSGAGSGSLSGSGTTYTATLSGLSSSTSYTVTVTCTDNAGNSGSDSDSFTTSSVGGGGATGSGGGVSTGVTGQYEKKVWTSINAGETATVEVTEDDIGVTNVEFKVAETTWGAWIKVGEKDELPTTVKSFERKVYKIVEFTERNIEKVLEGTAEIKFKVSKAWLTEQGLSKNNIALFRYADDKWNELPTTVGEDDGTFIHYSAEAPGFSYFVIGAKAVAVPEEVAEEVEEVAEEVEEVAEEVEEVAEEVEEVVAKEPVKKKTWLWITLIVVVAIAVVVWLVWFKKKK